MRLMWFILVLFFVSSVFSQTPNFSYSKNDKGRRVQMYWKKDAVPFDMVRVKDQKTLDIFLAMTREMPLNKADSLSHLYALVKFNQLHGNPKVRWLSEMPKWEKKLSGVDRSCFVFHANTMYLDTTNLRWHGVYEFWGSKFPGMWFTELSHADQLRINGKGMIVRDVFYSGIQFAKAGFSSRKYRMKYDETEYSNEESTEYLAHEIIEPYLYMQFQLELIRWQIIF